MNTTTSDLPVREVRVVWRGKQSEALADATLCLNLEGAIRFSKTLMWAEQATEFSDLFDGALESFNVREEVTKDTTSSCRCLTDGNNHLWVRRDTDGTVEGLTRWGLANAPGEILQAISSAFDVEIVSE